VAEPMTLLCVHPHPDDESISCGGVLARSAAEGHRTVVVTCTGGEAGENLAGIDLGGTDLAAHRRRELEDALAELGVHEHAWLGYRDSGMAGTGDNEHPEAFAGADVEEAARRLAVLLRRHRPDVVVSDDANGTYGHPDHVQAHRVTVRAVELAAGADELDGAPPWRVAKRYAHTIGRRRLLTGHAALLEAGLASPFGDGPLEDDSALPFGSPEELITTTVDVSPYLDRKRAALRAHRSQIGEDSFFLNTPEELTAQFFGQEEFVLEEGRRVDDPAVGRETDLFAGLRTEGDPDRPG
jgi:N-acetyl-1-D-myo-inositol-2-amino-2-deoxy-alpha-D-glucopyranoside deacetylase